MFAHEKFEIYEKVRDASTDWKSELNSAARELDEKVSKASEAELKKINVIKTVQLDRNELISLEKQLSADHSKSYQLYSFKHDGKKPIVAVFAIVPALKNSIDVNERAFVKSKEYMSFLSQLFQEKLIALCRETKTGFVAHKQLGYEFPSLKRALMEADEKSNLKRFLVENKLDIHVVEGREERGFQIVPHSLLTPQQRGLVGVNAKLSAVIVSAETLH